MARDATGCCEGPDPHGRGVLRRAPKGAVPKLAAKALTAPLFLAAVLRLPVVNLGALIHPHTYKVPGRMQAGLISELPRRVLLGNSEAREEPGLDASALLLGTAASTYSLSSMFMACTSVVPVFSGVCVTLSLHNVWPAFSSSSSDSPSG